MSEGILSIMTQSWPWDSKVLVEKSMKKKIPLDIYWRIQQDYLKVWAHSSLEQILEYIQDQMPLMNKKKTFLANSLMQNSFDAEQNTSGPFLRTQLAIRQESREQSFSEVTESFLTSICKFGRFKNPFAIITNLHEFYLESEDSASTNEKSDFYELWQ